MILTRRHDILWTKTKCSLAKFCMAFLIGYAAGCKKIWAHTWNNARNIQKAILSTFFPPPAALLKQWRTRSKLGKGTCRHLANWNTADNQPRPTSSPGSSRFPIWRRHIGKREDPGDEVDTADFLDGTSLLVPSRTIVAILFFSCTAWGFTSYHVANNSAM